MQQHSHDVQCELEQLKCEILNILKSIENLKVWHKKRRFACVKNIRSSSLIPDALLGSIKAK
jgi:hypothetical protein